MKNTDTTQRGQGLPAEHGSASEVCECQLWCQAGNEILASHHRNCLHYNLECDCHKIITGLLRGIEASAQDTDGIHPDLWEAYKRAKAAVWELDWKEEEGFHPEPNTEASDR